MLQCGYAHTKAALNSLVLGADNKLFPEGGQDV